jgi:glycosyltransferase involved in cell wall biosynthesis
LPDKRKNILFYCGGFQPVGGVESFTIDLIDCLPREMADISLVMWGKPLSEIPGLGPIKRRASEFRRSFVRWGCRWNVPDRVLLPVGLRMARRADLLVFAKIMPLRVHLKLRNVPGPSGGPIPSVLVIPYRPAEMWPNGPDQNLLDCFDVIVVPAPSFADDLHAMNYRGRVEVLGLLPPPAAPVSPRPHSENGSIRLGFLGRLEHQKNIPYMLEIFQRLSSAPEPFELHLFGDGSQRQELEQKAAQNSSASRIVFHGTVAGKAKWDAIDSCDLFLNTSWTEGQCIVALEVLSRGRPLAATPVGALPHIIDSPQVGSLIPLNDSAAAAAIVANVASRWKSEEINPSAIRARSDQRFGRDAIASGYVRLFSELLSVPAPDQAALPSANSRRG